MVEESAPQIGKEKWDDHLPMQGKMRFHCERQNVHKNNLFQVYGLSAFRTILQDIL